MRFKILVFVLTLALLGGTFLAAYWFYDTIDQPERLAEQQLLRRQQQTNKGPAPDPSAPSFQKINDALAAGQLEDVHEQLNRLLKVYPDSPWETEARRMLGEMNVDRLFSRSPMPGKRDYIVKSGDSLAKIEKGSLTTIPFLKRLNNLTSLNLQPGDRLVYQPLEFELEVRLADEVLTVRQKAAAGLDPIFFKNYRLTAVAVAPTFPKVLKTQIQEKPAWVRDRKVLATDPQYAFARKQLLTTGRPGRPGVLFRPDSERVTVPTGGVSAAVQGIFLDDGDLEELSTILRTGTPVVILRQ
jgi:LysM repeat protein